MYSIILVSGLKQSDSVFLDYTPFKVITKQWLYSPVPYDISFLLIHFYSSLFLKPIIPHLCLDRPLSPLETTSVFSIPVSLFLFCYIHSFVLFLRFHVEFLSYGIHLSLSVLFH